ncbi:MAG TPA: glycoside hydrolase family 25 protein [Bacteroidia bacterium]|nr:glycoside hydrolase family 25 protein [Bacteroidia bacterium]
MAKGGGNGWRWLFAFALLASMAAGGWWLWKNRYPIKGIDVSRYQGKIDWRKVKAAGYRFAFIKATEGTDYVDPYFAVNWDEAGDKGVVRGAYHFFRPGQDGKAQAEHFLKHLQVRKGDLPPVLDLEVTDDATAAAIRREALEWLQTVENATGMKPIVYTLPHFADSYLDSKLARYPLWVVDLTLFRPSASLGWPNWTFWQHSHRGRVDGIAGDVDLNVFGGSEPEFRRLLK